VKKQFGTTRKIMRIGKFLEHLKAAAVAFDNKSPVDPVLRYLAIGRQLGYAGYLTLDAVTVIDVIGIRKLSSAKRVQDSAYRSWAAGLIFSTVAGIYTLVRLQEKEKTIDRKEGEGVVEAKKIEKYGIPVYYQRWEWECMHANTFLGSAPLLGYSSSLMFAIWRRLCLLLVFLILTMASSVSQVLSAV
jgi:predicted AlkP superfamily phosphohydrolase/phosphomutase